MHKLLTTKCLSLNEILDKPWGQAPWLTHIWTRIAIFSVSLAYPSIIYRLLPLGIHNVYIYIDIYIYMYTGAKSVSIVFI